MSCLPQLPDPDRFVSQATSLALGLRPGSGKQRSGQRRENWRYHSTQPVRLLLPVAENSDEGGADDADVGVQ